MHTSADPYTQAHARTQALPGCAASVIGSRGRCGQYIQRRPSCQVARLLVVNKGRIMCLYCAVTIVVGTRVAIMPATASADASATPAPAVRTVRIQTAGVSLQYPQGWIVLSLTPQGIAEQQTQLSKQDPNLGAAVSAETQTATLPTTKFQASDLASAFAGGVSSDVNVQVVPGGFPSTLRNFTAVREPSVEQLGGTVLNASTVKVSGQTSYRLEVTLPVPKPDGSLTTTRLGQLLIRHGAGRVVVTIAAPDNDQGSRLIAQVLGSVRRI